MSDFDLKLELIDSAATEVLGAALADALRVDAPGGQAAAPTVIHLQGELGAGKTTCARSLLHALGVRGIVRSPSYTLVEIYAAGRVQCVHVDLYRLQGPEDLEDLGLRDYMSGGNLVLIEWPERGAGALPPADLVVTLGYRGPGREALVAAPSVRAAAWVQDLRTDRRLVPYLPNLT
jgi:tRNA threonylcarbamoyladenosine biosynthesis protein TsaE